MRCVSRIYAANSNGVSLPDVPSRPTNSAVTTLLPAGIRAGVEWFRKRMEKAVEDSAFITSSLKPRDEVTRKLTFLSEAGVPPKELLARCVAVYCYAEARRNVEFETTARNMAAHTFHALPLGCRSAHYKAKAILGNEIFDALAPLFLRISQVFNARREARFDFHEAVDAPFAGEQAGGAHDGIA